MLPLEPSINAIKDEALQTAEEMVFKTESTTKARVIKLPGLFREFYRTSDNPVLSLTITRQNDATVVFSKFPWTGALDYIILKFFCDIRNNQSLRRYSASADNKKKLHPRSFLLELMYRVGSGGRCSIHDLLSPIYNTIQYNTIQYNVLYFERVDIHD